MPHSGKSLVEFRNKANSSSSPTTASKIYETLRARIVALELPPGERLLRPKLADQFGVSPSPLREAIQRLEWEGLVATFRQSRTVVTHIDPDLLQQEHFLRRGVECEVVNTLAAMPDKSALNRASAIVRMQEVLQDDTDQIDLFRKLDDDFHKELFSAAGLGALHEFVTQNSSQMARLRSLDLPSEGKLRSIVISHKAIIDSILSGDCHAATDAMRAHLSGTISRLPEIISQHPAFFVKTGERAETAGAETRGV